MSYQTIMVYVDQSKSAEARIRLAATLALRDNAHLIGIAATGVSSQIFNTGSEFLTGSTLTEYLDRLRERAAQELKMFEKVVNEIGVISHEQRMIDDEPSGGVSLQGRFSDLIVLGQTDLDQSFASVMSDFPEYVVIESGRPVLIVPHSWRPVEIGKDVLVAWDASIGASRAITNALPFLRHARNVKVAILNPDKQPNITGDVPGNDIALYLARHGVRVEVARRSVSGNIGEAILTLAAETQSDSIVMGCYGHSRFREIMLGGVTHTVLDAMTVPVLMSH